jgi:hypothetical protein
VNLSDRIHDRTVRDTLQVLRYEAGLSRRVLAHLRGLERDLKAALADAGDIRTKKRLNALLKEAQEAIRDRYAGAQGVYDEEAPQFISAQAESMRATLNGLVKVDIFRHSLTTEQIQAIASDTLITGAPSAEWWAAQSSDTLAKFTRIVRMGMLQGQTGDEMAREVRDMMGTSMRNAQALVRTSVITTNNAAHMALYEANADVLKGVQWSATLDTRTCLVAGTPVATPYGPVPIESIKVGDAVLGGSRRPMPTVSTMSRRVERTVKVTLSNGETVQCTTDHLWLKSNQEWVEAKDLKAGDVLAFALNEGPDEGGSDGKSGLTVVSVEFVDGEVEVFDIEVGGDHSFIVHGAVLHNCQECGALDGQTWKMGDKHPMPSLHMGCRCSLLAVTKSFEELTGIKGLDDIPESTRASMDGQVASSTTYLDWLGRQDAATKADILGPGRARLLEAGKISLSDLVDQRGNELTLAQLKRN